jgi:hypothetical protein
MKRHRVVFRALSWDKPMKRSIRQQEHGRADSTCRRSRTGFSAMLVIRLTPGSNVRLVTSMRICRSRDHAVSCHGIPLAQFNQPNVKHWPLGNKTILYRLFPTMFYEAHFAATTPTKGRSVDENGCLAAP